jgi:hypothetical protein
MRHALSLQPVSQWEQLGGHRAKGSHVLLTWPLGAGAGDPHAGSNALLVDIEPTDVIDNLLYGTPPGPCRRPPEEPRAAECARRARRRQGGVPEGSHVRVQADSWYHTIATLPAIGARPAYRGFHAAGWAPGPMTSPRKAGRFGVGPLGRRFLGKPRNLHRVIVTRACHSVSPRVRASGALTPGVLGRIAELYRLQTSQF